MRKVISMKIKSTEPTIASSLLIQFAKDRKISVKELARTYRIVILSRR